MRAVPGATGNFEEDAGGADGDRAVVAGWRCPAGTSLDACGETIVLVEIAEICGAAAFASSPDCDLGQGGKNIAMATTATAMRTRTAAMPVRRAFQAGRGWPAVWPERRLSGCAAVATRPGSFGPAEVFAGAG